MIVSRNWLGNYVDMEMPLEDLLHRLTMTGLNVEGVESVGDDLAIDLEVTSNRPDCLSHIGVARELGVLFDRKLRVNDPRPDSSGRTIDAASLVIECEDLCPQYVARVVHGVKVGPAPQWLQARLTTVGIARINNIVDITNYVLMETGQPLHAFDLDRLSGGQIEVRRARDGERLVAIDQREYELTRDMCVICDDARPVAIGGVMGGLETEIGEATTNVLIETASFAPQSIRSTARRLGLHSPSSFRFERLVDRQGIDEASRRCCELILQTAGGTLFGEALLAGSTPTDTREPIRLCFGRIPEVLGIDIPRDRVVRILEALGLRRHGEMTSAEVRFQPPSWRRDLVREIDLIEEVARVHGYERIPDNAPIPVFPTARSRHERLVDRIRDSLTALGFDEAITLSFVSAEQAERFTPRTDVNCFLVDHSSRTRENLLRRSLIPSLLESRRENERHGSFDAELFEIAKVYLDSDPQRNERQSEPTMIGLVCGRDFSAVKGIVERLCQELNPESFPIAQPSDIRQFEPGRGAQLRLDGSVLGWVGELRREETEGAGVREAVTVAELHLHVLEDSARTVARYSPLPAYPAIQRDLNFVLDEAVAWEQLEQCVRAAAGPLLDSVTFGGQFRGNQIGPGRKSYVVSIRFQSPERTLTSVEVDELESSVIRSCGKELHAQLRQTDN